MAIATKQLEAIHQEIHDRFSEDPVISVVPANSNLPEKYEVTYKTTGVYKDDYGEIREKESHTITISIPFGFPHFPPSCKPKSQIFHPDFDPAAICIGDFWEKERSISDLIIHIGRMISGSIYSTSNAFNEEAATWYRENSSRLPFSSFAESAWDEDDLIEDVSHQFQTDSDDILSLLDSDQSPEDHIVNELNFHQSSSPSIDAESITAESPDQENTVFLEEDSSEEKDTQRNLFSDTDSDQLQSPDAEGLISPAVDDHNEPDPDRLKLMAKQKRFYELDQELRNLPERHSFQEQEDLAQQASAAIQRARERYNEGTDAEHQGSPAKALEIFQQVADIVSDYPGLQKDIARTTQAKALLGDWSETTSVTPSKETDNEAPWTVEEALPPPSVPEKKTRAKRTFFEQTARTTSRLIPFAVTIVLILFAGTIAVYYFLNSSTLTKAQAKLKSCQDILKQNRFTEAERQCEAALDTARKVQYFKSGQRDKLIESISTVLHSQPLTEGLKGNLLLDGKYLPKKTVKAIKAFTYFTAEGDKYFNDKSWQQAASSFKQALEMSAKENSIDPKLVFEVTEKKKKAEFNVRFRSGVEFIERKKWVLATEELNKALDLVKKLNIENKAEKIDAISHKLDEIALRTSKEKGARAFAEKKWAEALSHYQQALASVKDSAQESDPVVIELKQMVIRTQLYNTINEGKTAFTNADWDKAISNYQQAIELLENNKNLLKQASTEENKRKLARIMLQASIIRDQREAARYLKNKDYTRAIKKLQSITDSISTSGFSNESEFATVTKETKSSIEDAQTALLLEDKIVYLEENFEELFTANYTASPPESLTDREVVFDKKIGDILIFKLQCIEVGRGRPLKLVMKYSHNLKTGVWSFYHSTL
ncbi:MAG: hypothetical protein CR981_04790 [Proteobacteria bacterium]|nr:MAG: hypothetical protein CR981_04790 [Pseudomonadota bacterium]PIE65302.1 MAG: hypothetical protein CSA26_04330 [Desulfobacterales bacterium]